MKIQYLTGKKKANLIRRAKRHLVKMNQQRNAIYKTHTKVASQKEFNDWQEKMNVAVNKVINAKNELNRAYIGASNQIFQKLDWNGRCQLLADTLRANFTRFASAKDRSAEITYEEMVGRHRRGEYEPQEIDYMYCYRKAGHKRDEAINKMREVTEGKKFKKAKKHKWLTWLKKKL